MRSSTGHHQTNQSCAAGAAALGDAQCNHAGSRGTPACCGHPAAPLTSAFRMRCSSWGLGVWASEGLSGFRSSGALKAAVPMTPAAAAAPQGQRGGGSRMSFMPAASPSEPERKLARPSLHGLGSAPAAPLSAWQKGGAPTPHPLPHPDHRQTLRTRRERPLQRALPLLPPPRLGVPAHPKVPDFHHATVACSQRSASHLPRVWQPWQQHAEPATAGSQAGKCGMPRPAVDAHGGPGHRPQLLRAGLRHSREHAHR